MKDFDKVEKDEVKIVTQKQIENKKVFLGTARVRPGHRCFEINKITKLVKEADYKIYAEFEKGVRKQVNVQPDCIYIIALNKENALRKYNNAN
jgi:hypothetical protein